MISAGQITKQADKDGVPAATVERDYVLTHVLAEIASVPDTKRMVFKGGTALRLCYFDDYRYSADLDFSLTESLSVDDAREFVAQALERAAERVGFPQLSLTDHDTPRISYRGPLGRERFIKLDLASDELVDSPTTMPLLERFPDQTGAIVTVYDLIEITAEKLRCIIQRVQCRDLFDLHTLVVQNNVDIDAAWELFERKSLHKEIDPALFADRYEDRVNRYKKLWIRELDEHVPDEPPPFESIERTVRSVLRKHTSQCRAPTVHPPGVRTLSGAPPSALFAVQRGLDRIGPFDQIAEYFSLTVEVDHLDVPSEWFENRRQLLPQIGENRPAFRIVKRR
jgi:predicted nucleotidyltransferase component of viral defense system